MAKQPEELPPAPPLPAPPHTVEADELVKVLNANVEHGFTDAQAKDLQAFVSQVFTLGRKDESS